MSPVVLTGGNPPSEEHSLIKDLQDQLSMVRQNLKEMKAKADVALQILVEQSSVKISSFLNLLDSILLYNVSIPIFQSRQAPELFFWLHLA
jgi:hypothetical protein